jgi:hypothetical protein
MQPFFLSFNSCVISTRLKYFSLYKYGYQILARNEFDGLTFTCHADDVSCIPSTLPDPTISLVARTPAKLTPHRFALSCRHSG